MNCLMAGMVPVMTWAMKRVPMGHHPSAPAFWFIMSMALLVGFITAYPMNWWLVSHHLKHGMLTVQSPERVQGGAHESVHNDHAPSERTNSAQLKNKAAMDDKVEKVSSGALIWMTLLSCVILGLGLSIAIIFGRT